jgi:prepilin-type N-terminal cleavage/methylation domain-containing protein
MKKNITKDQKGFTIIEVLIVLAIAGLIILIVLLAVPALQRNSRNTQRKSDISALLGSVNEYVTNHQSSLPPDAGQITTSVKLGFYDPADINYPNARPTSPVTGAPGTDQNTVYIRDFAKCAAGGASLEPTGANVTKRNVVA